MILVENFDLIHFNYRHMHTNIFCRCWLSLNRKVWGIIWLEHLMYNFSSLSQCDALNQEVSVSTEALQSAQMKMVELKRLAQALEIELQSLWSMVSSSHFQICGLDAISLNVEVVLLTKVQYELSSLMTKEGMSQYQGPMDLFGSFRAGYEHFHKVTIQEADLHPISPKMLSVISLRMRLAAFLTF